MVLLYSETIQNTVETFLPQKISDVEPSMYQTVKKASLGEEGGGVSAEVLTSCSPSLCGLMAHFRTLEL